MPPPTLLASEVHEPSMEELMNAITSSVRARDPPRVVEPLPKAPLQEMWRPPPKAQPQNYQPDMRCQCMVSKNFAADTFLTTKFLDQREKERVIIPSRNFEKFSGAANSDERSRSIMRGVGAPRALPAAGNELCNARHRKRLDAHAEQREKQLYPVYQEQLRREAFDKVKEYRIEQGLPAPSPLADPRARASLRKDASQGRVQHMRSWAAQDARTRMFPKFQRQAEDKNTHDVFKQTLEAQRSPLAVLQPLHRSAPDSVMRQATAEVASELQVAVKWS